MQFFVSILEVMFFEIKHFRLVALYLFDKPTQLFQKFEEEKKQQ